MLKEKLPLQQPVHRQIPSGFEIIARPVQIFDAPPLAVKVHGQPLRHGGTDRTVPDKADEVRVLVEADALDSVVIHGIDAVRQVGKAVAGLVVAADASYLLRRIAEEVLDLEIRRQAKHGTDVRKAAFLQRGDLRDIALRRGVCAIVKSVVFRFKCLHGIPPGRNLNGLRELRGAVRAARGVDGDLTLAVGADLRFRRFRSGRFLFPAKRHDLLYKEEDHKRHDQKIEHLREERAVLEHRRTRGLRFGERGVGIPVEREKEIAEVDPAGQHADERHDDVVDERRYDLPERAADNDADRHIDHVSLYGEVLEFLE